MSGCQVASLGRGEMLCRKQLAGLMAALAAAGAALKLIGKGLSRQQVQASQRISRWDHQGWPWLVSALSDLSTVMLVLGISPRYVIYFTHFAPHSSQKPFAHLC